MGDKSKIQWTDATWNPLRGCSKVSEGCRNCYAMAVAARFSGPGQPYEGLAVRTAAGPQWTNKVMLVEDKLTEPLGWTKPRRIFVNSMSDLFHPDVPTEFIDRVFAVMALCPQHTFQVLTKRPERMRDYMAGLDDTDTRTVRIGDPKADFFFGNAAPLKDWPARRIDATLRGAHRPRVVWPLPNVWLGVSAEDQSTADARIPLLLQTPAAVRWVSAEPLLGPISLHNSWIGGCQDRACPCGQWADPHIDWVVAGGESGPNARPMRPEWARALRDQCQAAGIAYFHKQNGEYLYGDFANDGETTPCLLPMRVGKHAAGRLLDGRTWDQYPEVDE